MHLVISRFLRVVFADCRKWKIYDVVAFTIDGNISSNDWERGQRSDFKKAQSSLPTKGYLTTRFHPTRRFVG